MFLMRQVPEKNKQKNRITYKCPLLVNPASFSFDYKRCTHTPLNHLANFQYFIVALSGGFLHPRCTAQFFTYTKKLLKIVKKTTKIWINLPVTHIITKKALNVRMGKGKGGRKGLNAPIHGNTTLMAVLGSRPGLWKKIFFYVRARCSFKVGYSSNHSHHLLNVKKTKTSAKTHIPGYATSAPLIVYSRHNIKLEERRKVKPAIIDVYALLRKIKKIKLLGYMYKTLVTYTASFKFRYLRVLSHPYNRFILLNFFRIFGFKPKQYAIIPIVNNFLDLSFTKRLQGIHCVDQRRRRKLYKARYRKLRA